MSLTSERTTFGRRLGFVGAAYAFAVAMMGTTLPTPLYPLYESKFEFSSLMVTVIYAVYAIGVIAALLLFGQMSDQVGRRYILLAGLILSAISAIFFLSAESLTLLFIGRVLSGLSAGLFTGTATAALVDLAPQNKRNMASMIASAINMGGLGLGPLLSGVFSQYAALPLRLVFIVDLALIVLAFIAIWFMPEPVTSNGKPRLRIQRLRIPEGTRATFISAVIPGFAGFAVLGLFTAVAPVFLGEVLHYSNHALTGLVAFSVFAASTIGQMVLVKSSERIVLPLGCVGLIIGMVLVGLALHMSSLAWLVTGGIIAGLGQGLSFRAGLASVNASAPAEQRGEVTSSFFVILYIAISAPVVGVGFGAQGFGLQMAGIVFSAIVALVALIALVILLVRIKITQTS